MGATAVALTLTRILPWVIWEAANLQKLSRANSHAAAVQRICMRVDTIV